MNGKNYSCHPATVEWFSIQILVNLKFSLIVSLISSGLEDCLKSFSDRGSEISAFPSRFEQQLKTSYKIFIKSKNNGNKTNSAIQFAPNYLFRVVLVNIVLFPLFFDFINIFSTFYIFTCFTTF